MTDQEIKKLCREYGIYPKQSKGQNFLLCEEVIYKIISASDIKKGEVILEVGPGFGFLTKELAARAGKVVGIEFDEKLYKASRERLKGFKNVELKNRDILKLAANDLKTSLGKDYKIVANLPYNITGNFLKKFLSMEFKPNLMVLMLQKEVAERISALPGKMSLLSVSAQYYSRPEIILSVPKRCFYPVPEVDSAVVKFNIKKEHLREDEKKFFQIARIGFSARRKMLKNNLYNGFKGMGVNITGKDIEDILIKSDLKINARAQDLSVEDWKRLAMNLVGIN